MKNAADPGRNAALYTQAGTRIVQFPAPDAQHARRRAWLRLVAAARDADTTARLEAERARIAAHAAREVQE